MHTIGIDIGGTQLRAAVVDENYEIVDSIKTTNDRTLTCEQNMDKLLDFILKRDEKFRGIGIGSPGPLNVHTGTIIYPPNMIGWDDFGVTAYVQERTGLDAVLNNDGNIAALAEAMLGSGRGCESVVFVGISTGIGGGFVHRGEIVNGANCNAAEWWNMMVSDDDHCHKNANPGSLNEQASGSGLELIASKQFGRRIDSKTLFELRDAGDEKADAIIRHGAEMLARGLANITCIIDPDVIVIGGSVAHYHPDYLDLAVELAQRYLITPDALHIERAHFADDAGLIGAALLVR